MPTRACKKNPFERVSIEATIQASRIIGSENINPIKANTKSKVALIIWSFDVIIGDICMHISLGPAEEG